jgi:hypothetical protein
MTDLLTEAAVQAEQASRTMFLQIQLPVESLTFYLLCRLCCTLLLLYFATFACYTCLHVLPSLWAWGVWEADRWRLC